MHDDDFTKGLCGEFRGDFTRDTFDPLRRFSRVLMQQGRVQLDADWNEQVSIFSHYLRSLATHLIGPHGAPCDPDGTKGGGFEITANEKTFNIGYGTYYVNGILCQNNQVHEGGKPLTYGEQPDYPVFDEEESQLKSGNHLVYLDVWERHLSYVEDDYMREKALNGSDTATRAKIIWQVKWVDLSNDPGINPQIFKKDYAKFEKMLMDSGAKRPGTGRLRARAKKEEKAHKDPCLIAPEAQYRGAANQLYRVEIHKGSKITEGHINSENVTFKFSRENGSVIFPIIDIDGKTITLEHLGREARFGLKPNDWVEIVDDHYIFQNRADFLCQIDTVDSENSQVTLKEISGSTVGTDQGRHPYLRRWDQKYGDRYGLPVKEGVGKEEKNWIKLEDGIEVQFYFAGSEEPRIYHTGDYWLIPARSATGDVEWPGPVAEPLALGAQGVDHHYAPIGSIAVDANGVSVPNDGDLRRHIKKSWV